MASIVFINGDYPGAPDGRGSAPGCCADVLAASRCRACSLVGVSFRTGAMPFKLTEVRLSLGQGSGGECASGCSFTLSLYVGSGTDDQMVVKAGRSGICCPLSRPRQTAALRHAPKCRRVPHWPGLGHKNLHDLQASTSILHQVVPDWQSRDWVRGRSAWAEMARMTPIAGHVGYSARRSAATSPPPLPPPHPQLASGGHNRL